MGYVHYIINKRDHEAFCMDKHCWQFPDSPDSFASKEHLLEALCLMAKDWNWSTENSTDKQQLIPYLLALRDRIWRWKGDAKPHDLKIVGEDEYCELPSCFPVTGDRFWPTYVKPSELSERLK